MGIGVVAVIVVRPGPFLAVIGAAVLSTLVFAVLGLQLRGDLPSEPVLAPA